MLNPKNGNKLIIASALLIIAVLAASALQSSPSSISDADLSYHSRVCVMKTFAADGHSEIIQCDHNVLTNAGKNLTRDCLGIGGAAGCGTSAQYIAIENGTAPGATDTTLNLELSICGFTRAAGTYALYPATAGNWSQAKTFTSTCDAVTVNTTGLFNASSSGVEFAGNTFTSTTLQTNDQLTVNWTVFIT